MYLKKDFNRNNLQFVNHGPLYSTYWGSSLSSKSTFSLFSIVHLSFRKNSCSRRRIDCFF